MTKLEISRELADRAGLPLADATRSTDAFFDILKDAFANGRDIFVRGFGTFKVIEPNQRLHATSAKVHRLSFQLARLLSSFRLINSQ